MSLRYRVEIRNPSRCIGCYSCVFACSRHLFNAVDPKRTAVFVELDRRGVRAPKVSMCRFCKEPECAYACPHDALQPIPEGGITLTPSKCAVCKTYDCIEACQYKVLVLDEDKKVPILCDRCGECAKYCPHNVFWYTEAPEI